MSVFDVGESQFKVLQTYELEGGAVDLCIETAALETATETGQELVTPPLLVVRKASDGSTNR